MLCLRCRSSPSLGEGVCETAQHACDHIAAKISTIGTLSISGVLVDVTDVETKQNREGCAYQRPPWGPPTVSCVLVFGVGVYGSPDYLRGFYFYPSGKYSGFRPDLRITS